MIVGMSMPSSFGVVLAMWRLPSHRRGSSIPASASNSLNSSQSWRGSSGRTTVQPREHHPPVLPRFTSGFALCVLQGAQVGERADEWGRDRYGVPALLGLGASGDETPFRPGRPE